MPLNQLPSEIIAWENRIVEYESKPGADSVSESLKMATIVAMCPAKLKEHLQLNAARYTRYFEIREEIFTFLNMCRVFHLLPWMLDLWEKEKAVKAATVVEELTLHETARRRAARARRVAKARGRKGNRRTRARKAKAEDFSKRFAPFARRAGTAEEP